MRLQPCGCEDTRYDRIQRRWWMRTFFPGRRLYQCGRCNAVMLVPSQLALANNNGHQQ